MIASLFDELPFEQHRIVSTADLDAANPVICQALNMARFRVVRGKIIHNQMDLVPCGNLSLLRLEYGNGAEITVDPDCLDCYYLLVFPTRGEATFYFDGHEIAVSPNKAFLISPNRRFHFRASDDYEQILLRVDRTAIARAWHQLTEQERAPEISFDAVIPLHAMSWQALAPMLQWVVRCSGMSVIQRQAQSALLAQTETLVATTLLLHQPHNMAAQLWPAPPPLAPKAIRNAQTYMLDHLGERLPVAMVASHCGLSVRRLQALFQDECGQSPLQWLRMQRLLSVRRALSRADSEDNVSDIATRFGFTHLGEFSRAYRQAFGETPLQTRGRG